MTHLILSGGEVAAELIVVIGNVLRRFLFAYHEAILDIILEQCDIVICNIVLLKLRFCGPTLSIFVTGDGVGWAMYPPELVPAWDTGPLCAIPGVRSPATS